MDEKMTNRTDMILGYSRMKDRSLFDKDEIDFIEKNIDNLHRIGTTEYYSGIAGKDKNDPLRMQFIPDKREIDIAGYETSDPLCEKQFSPRGGIIHRYHDRILFLASGRCPLYCRHCFRRYLGERGFKDADESDVDSLIRYITEHRQIREVLISGGDPLMLEDDFLEYICRRIRAAGKGVVIRIGTRVPVVYPSRVDDSLAGMLSKYRPLYIFTQFNHSREITDQSSKAVELFVKSGIPVFNQSVLLRGINNSEAELESLFYSLVSISVKPYYLFQGDLASGTSHLRTPLDEGLRLMQSLREKMSLLSLPLFAVDLPGGGGKAALEMSSIVKKENGFYQIKSSNGRAAQYPVEG
ncbi:MAG: KamA family radical SAM protein [Spirochaetia bacterium]|jgi:lysine 2,3-aminomutase|nr:KamA family radical SAM protein [Spirochaetia bacterium]